MKKYEWWLRLVIVALIAGAVFVIAGTRHGHPRFPTRYGLDIKGGIRAVLQAHPERVPTVKYDSTTVMRIIENRINSSGVGEATVQPKGDTQFIVELPNVKNKNAVLEQLGTTAQMTFFYFKDVSCPRDGHRPVNMDIDRTTGHERYTFSDERTHQKFHDGASIRALFTSLLGEGTGERPGATPFTVPSPLSTALSTNSAVYLTLDQQKRVTDLNRELTAWQAFLASCGDPILNGNDIEPKTAAHLGGTLGTEPTVSQVFTASGGRKYADFTTAHVGEIVGIVLDDQVLSAPFIKDPITDGEGEISGGFSSLQEAQNLANLLNAGALPVPLEQVEVRSVEASLGQGAVAKSITAGLIGLALVLLFMLAYYRLPGVVADIALLIYSLFTLAIFKGALAWLFPGLVVTLTLPGIAGFILSIGMAVDANILIFERMKEEMRSGKSLRGSIDAGFKRAFSAIRDSNICTSITCIVLLSLGTPSVRGFALTLLIGVLVSLFSAVTVTRTLLLLLVDLFPKIGSNPALFGVRAIPPAPSSGGARGDNPVPPELGTRGSGAFSGLNIIGRRRFFYRLSLAIIVPGLFFYALGGLKQSIDFKGGTQIEVKYDHSVSQDAVAKVLASHGYPKHNVQMAEGGNVAIVSVPQQSSEPNPANNPVHQGLTTALNTLGPAEEQQFGAVGGTISREVTRNAFQAVVVASILIALYLAMVFSIGGFVAGLRLGTSAIIALLHDVLVLIGVFSILGYFLGWEIDPLFITAMLTVIGFSVHDTVVIFDRVRENLRHQPKGESFEHLVNRSIQQTLTRSLFTSLTVLMTLASLILFGGQTTRLLNVALFIGILSGTYSSICNAAAILVSWENWLARRRGAAPRPALAPSGSSSGGGAKAFDSGPVSPRPLPTRPETREPVGAARSGSPFSRPTTTDADSPIRPKKKRPARRF